MVGTRTLKCPLLATSNLDAGYGKKQVLFDVTMCAARGEIVSLVGHNGAGKTTLLRSIFGHIKPSRGAVAFDQQLVDAISRAGRVRLGMTYIPQEHFVFGDMTVAENLDLALAPVDDVDGRADQFARCFELLPILKERLKQRASTLSGGQQRMLSLGMTLVLNPRLLLLDEPSLGLAPSLVDSIMALLPRLAREGMTIVLVEQNVQKAFALSDYVYVLRGGRIIAERPGGEVASHDELWRMF